MEREFLGGIKIFRMSSACFVDCGIRKEVFGEVNGVYLWLKNTNSSNPMGEGEKRNALITPDGWVWRRVVKIEQIKSHGAE